MAFADKAMAKAKELAERAGEKAGDFTGSNDQHAEGQAGQADRSDQTKANLKQAGEKLKGMFRK